MTFDYARSKSTAERLIKRFGQSATLTQITNSGTAYNPSQAETDYSCILAVMNYKNSDVDGSLIKQGDKMVYLSTEGVPVTPSKNDSLTIGGEKHEVVDLMPLSPAGTIVFWKAQVRA